METVLLLLLALYSLQRALPCTNSFNSHKNPVKCEGHISTPFCSQKDQILQLIRGSIMGWGQGHTHKSNLQNQQSCYCLVSTIMYSLSSQRQFKNTRISKHIVTGENHREVRASASEITPEPRLIQLLAWSCV